MNIKEVKQAISNFSLKEINEVVGHINEVRSQKKRKLVNQFTKNTKVNIIHKNEDPNRVFIVKWPNEKTVTVFAQDDTLEEYRVSPGLLRIAE